MRYLSVCSGIEAATVAWHPLGWEAAAYSEIEPFPCKVLAHHYPNTPNLGDMTKFKEWGNYDVDLLVGGTPCQSFSVAGLRKGLDDPRGNLMLTYLAIADKYKPRYIVWENVPGVLSSNGGRDFATFLEGLAELGYGWAYRVLDAQFCRTHDFPHAVPQRRRRVFVVGCLGDGGRAAAVLFDSESLLGNSPPSRKARETVTHDVANCIRASGVGTERIGDTRGQDPVVCMSHGQANAEIMEELCPTLNCNHEQPIVTGYSSCSRQIASNASAVGNPFANNANSTMQIVSAPDHPKTANTSTENETECLKLSGKMCETPPIALVGNTIGRQPYNGGNETECLKLSGTMYTLTKTDVHAVCLPINTQIAMRHEALGEGTGMGVGADGDAAYTLQAAHSHAVAFNQVGATLKGCKQGGGTPDPSDGNGHNMSNMQVRRLTPTECARLQGFPDDFLSQVPGASDTQMYRALGNSMAVNVMQLIGERIEYVEELLK